MDLVEHSPAGRGLPIKSRYVVPNFVERNSNGTRELDPYGKLYDERIIFLGSQVDDVSANDIMAQMLCLEALDPDRDISLYINSPGGSFTAMTAIYDTMMFVKPEIQTVCLGQANSAAAVILAAGTPGKRMALPSARVLIHQPFAQGTQGQVSDLEIQAVEVERLRRLMEMILAKHCDQNLERIAEDVERDKIFTADEARKYGLVDHVVSPRDINGAG